MSILNVIEGEENCVGCNKCKRCPKQLILLLSKKVRLSQSNQIVLMEGALMRPFFTVLHGRQEILLRSAKGKNLISNSAAIKIFQSINGYSVISVKGSTDDL